MNFLKDIYRLSFIKRYSNIPRIHDESVAEHGFYVAAITIDLRSKYKFNLGEALLIAISHDMTEIELNDCPHIIKKKYPSIAKSYNECEKEVAKQLPVYIKWGSEQFDKKDLSIEAKIVHLADVIQCKQYSEIEIKTGNKGYMEIVHRRSCERIKFLEKELESCLLTNR